MSRVGHICVASVILSCAVGAFIANDRAKLARNDVGSVANLLRDQAAGLLGMVGICLLAFALPRKPSSASGIDRLRRRFGELGRRLLVLVLWPIPFYLAYLRALYAPLDAGGTRNPISYPVFQWAGALYVASLVAILSVVLWRGWRFYEEERSYRPPGCANCGYSLTGNTSGVCPECGSPVTGSEAGKT